MIGSLGLFRAAELSLVPLLVAASILLQQEGRGLDYLVWTGYLVSILAALTAMAVVFRRTIPRLGFLIILCVISLRVGKQLLPDVVLMANLYEVALLALMATAGFAVHRRDPSCLERQLSVICVIGLPLMLLQVLGVAEWTQVLRTDFHDDVHDLTQYPTLFAPASDLESLDGTLQFRPAGLFSSNNALSLIAAIAAGLAIWQIPRRVNLARDFMLAMVCVLSMSKTVFAVVAGVALASLIVGDVPQRRRSLRFILSVSACLLIYALFLPGLWARNVDLDLWKLNYALRSISIQQTLGVGFGLVDGDLREWAISLRPLLFDASGDLGSPEGGLATLFREKSWLVAIAGFAALAVAPVLFQHTDIRCLGKVLIGHAIIGAVCVVGLSFATSPVFALYVGSVVAAMHKCRREGRG